MRPRRRGQILWAEWLCEEVLAKTAHRHVVLTIPRLLRPLLRRRRELLTELGRAAAEAVSELVRSRLGTDARPGIVVSIATAGDLLQWHPHLHPLTTDGGRTTDGSWQPLPEWDGGRLMSLFRERLLARLVEARPHAAPCGEVSVRTAAGLEAEGVLGQSPRRRAFRRPASPRVAPVGWPLAQQLARTVAPADRISYRSSVGGTDPPRLRSRPLVRPR